MILYQTIVAVEEGLRLQGFISKSIAALGIPFPSGPAILPSERKVSDMLVVEAREAGYGAPMCDYTRFVSAIFAVREA